MGPGLADIAGSGPPDGGDDFCRDPETDSVYSNTSSIVSAKRNSVPNATIGSARSFMWIFAMLAIAQAKGRPSKQEACDLLRYFPRFFPKGASDR